MYEVRKKKTTTTFFHLIVLSNIFLKHFSLFTMLIRSLAEVKVLKTIDVTKTLYRDQGMAKNQY